MSASSSAILLAVKPLLADAKAAELSDSEAGLCRSRFFGTCRGGSVSVDDPGWKEAQELLVAMLRPVLGRTVGGF